MEEKLRAFLRRILPNADEATLERVAFSVRLGRRVVKELLDRDTYSQAHALYHALGMAHNALYCATMRDADTVGEAMFHLGYLAALAWLGGVLQPDDLPPVACSRRPRWLALLAWETEEQEQEERG